MGNIATTVNAALNAELTWIPAVLAGVQEVDKSQLSNEDKFNTVLNTIMAASQVVSGMPNPTVAGIGTIINVSVAIGKMVGLLIRSKQQAAAVAVVAVPVAVPAMKPADVPVINGTDPSGH